MSTAYRRASPWLLAAGLLGMVLAPRPAGGQTYTPGASLQPVLLTEAYLARSGWLLLPSTKTLDLAAVARSPEATRMGAYRAFESDMRWRTSRIIGGTQSADDRRRAKRKLLEDVGRRLEHLPGASLVRQGERLWRTVESSTDFALEGYRVKLRVDEAVEGKLALKIQKKFR